MRDTDLYKHLLGIVAPWTVARVELDVKGQRVDVWVEHKKGVRWECPEPGCKRECGLHGHAEERAWRHLDSCQFATFLHARIPRSACPEHGTKQVRVPWAEPNSRFTLLFERLALEVLRETTIVGGAKILGISWDEAYHLMERAVERGLARRGDLKVRIMGVDEKSVAKGQEYFTLIYDLVHKSVLHIEERRTRESLESFFEQVEPYDLGKIEAVAMDMWEAFYGVTMECVPNAEKKIVFDLFHIMQSMNKAVDKVRSAENRELRAVGDHRLTGTMHMWRYGQENLPEKYVDEFQALRKAQLKTSRAWALKELLRELWRCPDEASAREHWRRWYSWAIRSRLEPVKKVARMMKKRLSNIMTYFTHRITNATSEALNGTIQGLRKSARGFRSRAVFKTVIYFHCGGLDLDPMPLGSA